MAKFRDAENREWTVSITVATLRRLKQELQTDLMKVLDDDCRLLAEFYDNPVRLVELLYVICELQIQQSDVSPEQFAEGFSGDVLMTATGALIEAIADFFPNPKQRRILRVTHQRISEGVDLLLDRTEQAVNQIDVPGVLLAS